MIHVKPSYSHACVLVLGVTSVLWVYVLIGRCVSFPFKALLLTQCEDRLCGMASIRPTSLQNHRLFEMNCLFWSLLWRHNTNAFHVKIKNQAVLKNSHFSWTCCKNTELYTADTLPPFFPFLYKMRLRKNITASLYNILKTAQRNIARSVSASHPLLHLDKEHST